MVKHFFRETRVERAELCKSHAHVVNDRYREQRDGRRKARPQETIVEKLFYRRTRAIDTPVYLFSSERQKEREEQNIFAYHYEGITQICFKQKGKMNKRWLYANIRAR